MTDKVNIEVETTVFQTTGKNGKTYKNIDIKKGNIDKKIFPIDVDCFVVVTKKNDTDYPVTKTFIDPVTKESKVSTSYLIVADYKGDEVSFFLNKNEHEKWLSAGVSGQKIRLYRRTFTSSFGKRYSIESMLHNA